MNNQAGEYTHSTYILNCTATYRGAPDDSYGVRVNGTKLFMENVTLTYTGNYGSNFDAFIVIRNNNTDVVWLNNCHFYGYDDVTETLDAGHKKDIFVKGAVSVGKLIINGKTESMTTVGTSGSFYNFPRYTVSVESATGGTAKISDGHNEGSSIKAMEGAELTLSYGLNSNYVFDGWDVSGDEKISVVNKLTVGKENVTVTPEFRNVGATTHGITITKNGFGTVSQSTSVENGADFVLVAVADINYKVSSVKVNGQEVGAVGMYTVENVTANVSIEVTFEYCPGMTTIIDGDGELVIESKETDCEVGVAADVRRMDADGNVINQKAVGSLILDVVTTATVDASERYKDLVDTIESKITVSSEVDDDGIAKVVATKEYLDEADKQIAWLKNETGITEDPIYMMNVHSDDDYIKISAEFDKSIVSSIYDNNGQLAISSGDKDKCSKSSVVLDNYVVKGLMDDDFSWLNLTVGLSEKEELTPEQLEVVGDNTVVFAKLELFDSDGNVTTISGLGGTARISLEYEFESDNPEFYIYYVTPEGDVQLMPNATYNPYTKTISFTTNHFSQFMIVEHTVEPLPKHFSIDLIIIIVATTLTICTIVSTWDYSREKKY